MGIEYDPGIETTHQVVVPLHMFFHRVHGEQRVGVQVQNHGNAERLVFASGGIAASDVSCACNHPLRNFFSSR